MAARIKADVEPRLLVWARESIGYSQDEAARKIGTTVGRLQRWESGEDAPTVGQLRKAADVYKRPLAVFYLPEPPRDFQAMRDFRRLPDEEEGDFSPELRLAIRTARWHRDVVLQLLADRQERSARLPLPPANARQDAAQLARFARGLLRVELEEQFGWRRPYDALHRWTRALEGLGVLVFQTGDVEREEMRGFSLSDQPVPVIVANAKDAPNGRVFTLMHELAHVLLHSGGVCDLGEGEPRANAVEVFCNRVAGEILVPSESLQTLIDGLPRPFRGEWPEEHVASIARRFSVSEEVVLRRLLTLGVTTLAYYRRMREHYLERFLRARAAERVEAEGFLHPAERAFRDRGRAFVGLVLDAYHREAITSADLAGFLGVRLKHLDRIEGKFAERPA